MTEKKPTWLKPECLYIWKRENMQKKTRVRLLMGIAPAPGHRGLLNKLWQGSTYINHRFARNASALPALTVTYFPPKHRLNLALSSSVAWLSLDSKYGKLQLFCGGVKSGKAMFVLRNVLIKTKTTYPEFLSSAGRVFQASFHSLPTQAISLFITSRIIPL